MKINASGRSALILAAGIALCCAGPLHADDSVQGESAAASSAAPATAGAPVKLSKFTKRHRRHWTRHASAHTHKSAKVAAKTSSHPKAVHADTAAKDDGASPAIPDNVANAQAQASDTDTTISASVGDVSNQADKVLQTMNPQPATSSDTPDGSKVVAADELNDVDRALSDNQTPVTPAATAMAAAPPAQAIPAAPPAMAMAAADTPAAAEAPTEVAAAATTDDSAWGKSSLIGKIFIGFGGLLTLASAARMFIV